jgi:putative N6-adenine-specific DNA methylase
MLVERELDALGVGYCRARRGGVEFRASTRQLYAANVWSRTATRIITRVSNFRARSFEELEAGAADTPWFDFASAERAVRFSVTSHRSRLYHTDAIAERFARVFGRDLGDDADDAQLFVIRFDRDMCTVSADTSGRPLHQRGWRLATSKAPLRPTLAAAVLLSCGWAEAERVAPVLLDPMCGSGTIAIEAALIAAQRAPGAGREFSFQQWPSFEPGTWASVRASLRATRDDLPPPPRIVACDRDGGAIDTTIANAERAGVADLLHTHAVALSATSRLDEVRDAVSGIVVTNPPYGVRVTSSKGLRDLYASLGNLARGPLASWDLAFLAADDRLARATGLALSPLLRTKNGGIDVTLWQRRPTDYSPHTVHEPHLTTLREQDA